MHRCGLNLQRQPSVPQPSNSEWRRRWSVVRMDAVEQLMQGRNDPKAIENILRSTCYHFAQAHSSLQKCFRTEHVGFLIVLLRRVFSLCRIGEPSVGWRLQHELKRFLGIALYWASQVGFRVNRVEQCTFVIRSAAALPHMILAITAEVRVNPTWPTQRTLEGILRCFGSFYGLATPNLCRRAGADCRIHHCVTSFRMALTTRHPRVDLDLSAREILFRSVAVSLLDVRKSCGESIHPLEEVLRHSRHLSIGRVPPRSLRNAFIGHATEPNCVKWSAHLMLSAVILSRFPPENLMDIRMVKRALALGSSLLHGSRWMRTLRELLVQPSILSLLGESCIKVAEFVGVCFSTKSFSDSSELSPHILSQLRLLSTSAIDIKEPRRLTSSLVTLRSGYCFLAHATRASLKPLLLQIDLATLALLATYRPPIELRCDFDSYIVLLHTVRATLSLWTTAVDSCKNVPQILRALATILTHRDASGVDIQVGNLRDILIKIKAACKFKISDHEFRHTLVRLGITISHVVKSHAYR